MKTNLSYAEQQEKEKLARATFNANNERLAAIINPLRRNSYAVDFEWRHIGESLPKMANDYGVFDMCPDFQRGHVWTKEQQLHYVENALRGIVSAPAFVLQFNCPNWEDGDYQGDLPRGFQCIDGLQRYTAIQEYVKGNIKPFGLSHEDMVCSSYSIKGSQYRFRVEVYEFTKKVDLIRHYLDLNTGGTPHTAEEIERVKGLL